MGRKRVVFDIEAAVKMYDEGMSYKWIGEHFNLNGTTIKRHIWQLVEKDRSRRQLHRDGLGKQKLAEAVEMFNQGMTSGRRCRVFGCLRNSSQRC